MKNLLLVIVLFSVSAFAQTTTEFYADASAGSNLNAGAPIGGSYPYTYAGGNWDGTSVFTVASGNPSTDGPQVGDFASVYVTAGATDATYIGRITALSSTTVTISTTAKSGTAPASGTGTLTLKVGGAWKGPNGTDAFPLGFINKAMTDASGHVPRVNFKNNATYTMTDTITLSVTGPMFFQGYTTNPGDGGKAVFSWGTNTNNGGLLVSGGYNQIIDMDFAASGSFGGVAGLATNAGWPLFKRVSVHGWPGYCWNQNGQNAVVIELEIYNCNTQSLGIAGLNNTGAYYVRPYIHDNLGGTTSPAFRLAESATIVGAIVFNNSGDGILQLSDLYLIGGDFYNNGRHGLNIGWTSGPHWGHIENVNFLKNAGYGLTYTGSVAGMANLVNPAFGAGTMANASGTVGGGLTTLTQTGTVTYASGYVPWSGYATGNFSVDGAASKAAGYANWTQRDGTHSGTTAAPVLGAAQPSASGGGGTRVY